MSIFQSIGSGDDEILDAMSSAMEDSEMDFMKLRDDAGTAWPDLMYLGMDPKKPASISPVLGVIMASLIGMGTELEEGVFRRPGDEEALCNVIVKLGEGVPLSMLIAGVDSLVLAALLKKFYRELPHPIVPKSLIPLEIRQAVIQENAPLLSGEHFEAVKALLKENLSTTDFELMSRLCSFLAEFESFEESTHMNRYNLAMVFAPNIIRSTEEEDPMSAAKDIHWVVGLMKEFIGNSFEYFAF